MATARIKLVRNTLPSISATYWAMLRDAELPPDLNRWELFGGVSAELWRQFCDTVMAEWLVSHPGRRPRCWWGYSAPRWSPEMPGCADWPAWLDLCAPRLRLGGRGTATHDALADTPAFEKGIPTSWLTASDVAFYTKGDDFPYDPFDPSDRPQFESEAAYLLRHKLLLPGERKRLRKADFEPETVPIPDNLEIDDDETN